MNTLTTQHTTTYSCNGRSQQTVNNKNDICAESNQLNFQQKILIQY